MKYVLDVNVFAYSDPNRLSDIVPSDGKVVLIDSLFYEVCTSEKITDWQNTLRKLRAYASRIECWRHIGEALRKESEDKKQCPLYDEELTRRIKAFLTSNVQACDIKTAVTRAKRQREKDSPEVLFSSSGIFRQLLPQVSNNLASKSYEDISEFATRFVNDRDNILLVLGKGAVNPVFDADLVDSSWVAWHNAKAFLAFLCEFMRSNPLEDIEALTVKAKHRWINSKIDLDYAVSTAFADGLLTQERKALRYFCRWMFGDSRRVLPA